MEKTTVSRKNNVWPTRLYYLFWFAATGFVWPFRNPFLVSLGLTGTDIGWISAISSVVTLVAAPLWANRNDRWRNPRVVLQLLLVIAGVANYLLSQQVLFLGVVLVMTVLAFIFAGIAPLSDGLALRVTEDTQAGYGSIRVYGSVGWMIFVLLAGWVVEQTEYRSSLIGGALLTLVAAAFLFPIEVRHFASGEQQAGATKLRDVIGQLLSNRVMLGAALMTIIIGVTGGGVYQFQSVYLGQLGAGGEIIGIAGMVASVIELPFMIWSDGLIKRWGASRLLEVAMLIYVGMRGIIFVFPSIPLILFAEAVTGVGYSFLTVALVRVIAEQSSASDTRTVLALYTVTLTNLISIIGGPITGLAFDHLGARSLYLIAAAGYALAWLSLYLTRTQPRADHLVKSV